MGALIVGINQEICAPHVPEPAASPPIVSPLVDRPSDSLDEPPRSSPSMPTETSASSTTSIPSCEEPATSGELPATLPEVEPPSSPPSSPPSIPQVQVFIQDGDEEPKILDIEAEEANAETTVHATVPAHDVNSQRQGEIEDIVECEGGYDIPCTLFA